VKRTITILCAGAVIALAPATSAVAAEGNGGRSAVAKQCTALKKADKAAFEATYGDNAMRNCMKGVGPEASEVTPAEFKNAAKACRAERNADPVLFAETHGTNANGKNAFGKCVSGAVRDRGGDDGEDDEGADDGGEDTGGEDTGEEVPVS
jgi:hypothetical protein